MSVFLINDKIWAKGEMTIQQQLVDNKIIVSGIMELDRYIEDIEQIETKSFFISGVTITKEVFGTSERKVVYEFVGKGLGIDKETFNNEETEGV